MGRALRVWAVLLAAVIYTMVLGASPAGAWHLCETHAAVGCDREGHGEGSPVTLVVQGVRIDADGYLENGTVVGPMRRTLEGIGATVVQRENPDVDIPAIMKATLGQRSVTITVGSRQAAANGRALPLTATPKMHKGQVYAPIRAIATALGATVNWDPDTNTETVARPGYTPLPSGSAPAESPVTIRINGTVLDGAAAYLDPVTSRTMIPVRAVAEATSAAVHWYALNRVVTVTHWRAPYPGWETLIFFADTDVASLDMLAGLPDHPAFVATQVELDVKPAIRNGRTYLPLRFLTEFLGYAVRYDPGTRTADIDTRLEPFYSLQPADLVFDSQSRFDVPRTAQGRARHYPAALRTLVPIAERLNATVLDQIHRTVIHRVESLPPRVRVTSEAGTPYADVYDTHSIGWYMKDEAVQVLAAQLEAELRAAGVNLATAAGKVVAKAVMDAFAQKTNLKRTATAAAGVILDQLPAYLKARATVSVIAECLPAALAFKYEWGRPSMQIGFLEREGHFMCIAYYTDQYIDPAGRVPVGP